MSIIGKQTTQHILGDCLSALKDWKHPNPSPSDPEHPAERRMSIDSLQSTTQLYTDTAVLSQSKPPNSVQQQEQRRQSYQTAPIQVQSRPQSIGGLAFDPERPGLIIQPENFISHSSPAMFNQLINQHKQVPQHQPQPQLPVPFQVDQSNEYHGSSVTHHPHILFNHSI